MEGRRQNSINPQTQFAGGGGGGGGGFGGGFGGGYN